MLREASSLSLHKQLLIPWPASGLAIPHLLSEDVVPTGACQGDKHCAVLLLWVSLQAARSL